MTPSRASIVLFCVAAGTSALAATLPFRDGFEPPQTGFSSWTSTRVNGANTLTQSTARAFGETQSLTFTYAGASASAQAAAVVDFSASTTTAWVRFWLFVPAGTAAAMGSGTTLRLVKLGDALSGATGSGGAARVNLALRRDSTGPVHLRLDYANASAGTTTFGTALTTPITEGTWHFVELGYQPGASPRVRIFIDDPSTPRIDAAPGDTVAHALLTAWVGLADQADAQTAPVSLSLDDVQVGTAQAGTALATPQHFNELESGTLAVTSTPPGKAAATFTAAGLTASAAPAAAHRGAYGLRITDGDGTAGAGSGAGQTVRITAATGTVYRRFFWRTLSPNGLGSRTLATLTSTTASNRALAEVIVAGNGAVSLGGFDSAGVYVTTTSALTASPSVWHLVELVATGVGTASGTRKLYLDGTLAAQRAAVSWTAMSVDAALEGQTFSNDRAWQGTDDFDDLRISRDVMPSRLTVTAGAMTDRQCSGAITVEARDSDGTPRGVAEPTTVTLSATGVPGGFYSDASCAAAIGTVQLPVGTTSASVYFRPTAAGAATLRATNTDYLSQPDTAPVASLATRLGFATLPKTVAAGACSSVVTVQTQDTAGAAATVDGDTPVALVSSSMTTSFFSDASCATPITSINVATGTSSAGFYFRDTAAGSITVSLSSMGLTGAMQLETVTAASPSKLVFTLAPLTVVAGECSAALTVQARDTYGNPATVGAATPVTFSSSSTGAGFFTNAGCTMAGGVVSIPSGMGSATVYFRDTRAGMPLVTAAAAGFLNGSQAQLVQPAAAAQLVLSSAPQTVTAGACSGATVVEAQDAFGNTTNVTADTMVSLSSMPANVTFYAAAGCMGMGITGITIASGTSSGTFYFISSAAGTAALTVASPPLTAGNQTETISASGPTRLQFFTPSQSVAAGNCSGAVLIQTRDSFGNLAAVAADLTVGLTSSSTTLRFSPTGACASTVTSVTIPAGLDSVAVYFRDTAAGMPGITAAVSPLSPAMQVHTVRPAPPSQLAIATPPQTLVAGACSSAVTAQARDGFQNPANVVSNTTIALTTTSPQGRWYSDAACMTQVMSTVIAANSNSATVYYRDTRAGTATLTASNAGLSAPTQGVTVEPAAPSKVVFLSAPQTMTAGSCSLLANVQVRDQFDNVSPVSAATAVELASTSMTTTFHSDPMCAMAVSSVALAAMGSQVGFYFRDPTAGRPTLSASVTGLTPGTQQPTFNAGPPVKLAFFTPPRTVTAGQCSLVLSAQLQDANDNAVPFAMATQVSLSTSSSTGALYSNAACTTSATQLSAAAASTQVDLYFKDTTSGPWGVTATAGSFLPASQTVTVAAGPAVRLAVLTPAQTLAAGACSAPVTVEAYDALDNPVVSGASVALSSSAATTRFFGQAMCSGPPVTAAVMAQGQSQVTFWFQEPKAGMPLLTMTLAGVPPATQAQVINAGAPMRLGFTTPPQSVSRGTCSAPVTVEVQDTNGNASPPPGAVLVDLSSSSLGTTFYEDATCTSPIVSVGIDGGTMAAASLHFKDLTLGTTTLTARATGLAAATQDEQIVTPGVPARLQFASAPYVLEASQCSGVVIVEVKDATGNSSPVPQAIEVTLSSTPPTATFHASGTCGAQLTRVTVPAGAYQALFHFRDPVAHPVKLTASATGLTAASQDQRTNCPATVDGAFCDDLDLCNGRETCAGGACVAGTAPTCMDTEDCTIDACEPALGCTFEVRAGCCRPPVIAMPSSLTAAVGVPWRVGPGARATLLRGTGPTRWTACDTPPPGFNLDATTGQLDWVPAAAGAVPVCLNAVAACGQDTVRFTVQVAATPPPRPVANATFNPPMLTVADALSGDATTSTGAAPLSFEWSWGDQTPGPAPAMATHRYALGGNYRAGVTVFDAVGQSAQSPEQRIAVSSAGCMNPPIARIAADALTGDGSLTAALRCDCSPVPGAVYTWDFGDGTTGFGEQASHTFAPGAYQVRLSVSAGGCTSSDFARVLVTSAGKRPPWCSVTVAPAGGAAPLTTAFVASFNGVDAKVASARWAFSDGLEADALKHDAMVSRTVDVPGRLEAALTVTDEAGLSCHASAVATATTPGGATPPRVMTTPVGAARCGEAWSYAPGAVGTGPIAWSLGKTAAGAGQPSGMSVDPANGALAWTPDSKTRGPTRVTLVAANEAGVVEQDFLVEVECARGCACGSGGFAPAAVLLALLLWRRRRARVVSRPGRA